MDADKVDFYLMANGRYFPSERIFAIKERLLALDVDKSITLASTELKDPAMIFFISLFLGTLGIDRFMIGDTGMGIGKLLTFGGCGLWALIDLFFIMGRTKEKNFLTLMSLV